MRKKFAQVLDILASENAALMRVMEEKLAAVQHHAKARSMDGVDFSAQMMQQGLDFPPVDVGAGRILKKTMQQVQMFVAHSGLPERSSWRRR